MSTTDNLAPPELSSSGEFIEELNDTWTIQKLLKTYFLSILL